MPNPPAMMLTSERFMASAISLVRMPPAAPTSAPAMISGVLLMTKPAMATAVPVKAFSSEMTTGMSAPPIGSVSEHTEGERGDASSMQDRHPAETGDVAMPAAHRDHGQHQVDQPTAGNNDRRPGILPASLPPRSAIRRR